MGRSDVFTATLALIAVVLLCLMFLMITYTAPQPAAAGWELPGNGSVDYMFIGGNDTLYAFRGNDVAAVRSDGSLAWTFTVPGNWSVLNNWSQAGHTIHARPVVAESSGHLYLIAVKHLTAEEHDRINSSFIQFGLSRVAVIIAISPDGKEEWEYPFAFVTPASMLWYLSYDDTIMPYTIALTTRNGNLYLFKDYNEQIIDPGLKGVKIVDNVASPAAIDEEGRIYVVRSVAVSDLNQPGAMPSDADITESLNLDYGGIVPTSIVEAYGPDRTLLWSRDIGHSAVRQEIWDKARDNFNSLPLYINGTLYVPIKDGVIALDRDGSMKWECHLPENDTYALFGTMPVDASGNVYIRNLGARPQILELNFESFVQAPEPEKMSEYLYIITPQGSASRQPWVYGSYGSLFGTFVSLSPLAADNGIIYAVNSTGAMNTETFSWMLREGRLNPDRLMALDAKSGAELWNFTVPAVDKNILRLNADNLAEALPGFSQETVDRIMAGESRVGWSPDLPFFFHGHDGRIEVYPGGNVTYLNYNFATYESPIIYGKSRCIYARSLYAIDGNGNMLWKKSVDGLVTAMAANNSTFFYGTSDGRIGTVTGNAMVAGIALAASLYLFLRFFLLGTISRAKTKLNKNENRNIVLRYIVDNPGVTAVDVSKALKMNLGTTRYHLFILTANHRIITHKEDSKFLRYFSNAGTYSEKERALLSLIRREPLKRILKTLAERPGLSNLELARELNVSTAAVHDNVNELYARGIVTKDTQGERGYAYAIKEEYRSHVLQIMQR
ncbi:MAG TPA: winged helix-turn-helix transcriptional regulator, partial [Methanocella sp.]